jgi:multimeric flavodoxin WrbA
MRALFLNCTLKQSPRLSNTDALIEASRLIMTGEGVEVDALRPVDLEIATGMKPDMTEEGWERDHWPALYKQILRSDILVLATPIWLGEKSSVCTRVIERLYSNSSDLNDLGQPMYYNRVGGCLVTGNEDGVKHCARDILYALQHMGFLIPPQAEAGWVGEAGPGPSYRDKESSGPESDFTNRTLTAMSWNMLHAARMIRQTGGIPPKGNSSRAWKEGQRFGHPGADSIRAMQGGPSERPG